MAQTLLPFRDYDEHDVINLFAIAGTADKGLVVMGSTSATDGWRNTDELSMLGAVGGSFSNTLSQRYGTAAVVVAASGTATSPLGILLHDVKETDENGEKLVFNPRKAAEMGVSLSGQATPIASRGIFLYSGSDLAGQTPVVGTKLYHDSAGAIVTGSAAGSQVGVALGSKDSNNHVLIKLNL